MTEEGRMCSRCHSTPLLNVFNDSLGDLSDMLQELFKKKETTTTCNITTSIASDYQVTVEGVMQTPYSSYTISAVNQNILFSEAPPVNSVIVIVKRY